MALQTPFGVTIFRKTKLKVGAFHFEFIHRKPMSQENGGPCQWFDSLGNYHLLLPILLRYNYNHNNDCLFRFTSSVFPISNSDKSLNRHWSFLRLVVLFSSVSCNLEILYISKLLLIIQRVPGIVGFMYKPNFTNKACPKKWPRSTKKCIFIWWVTIIHNGTMVFERWNISFLEFWY